MEKSLKTEDFNGFDEDESLRNPIKSTNLPTKVGENDGKSSGNPIFPNLDSTKLMPFLVIKQQFLRFPDLLGHPSCPYSQDVKDFLQIIRQGLFADVVAGYGGDESIPTYNPEVDSLFQSGNTWDVLLSETQKIYVSLISHRNKVDAPGAGTNQATQYYKGLVTLIEKMVELNKEVLQLKEISSFKAVVLEIFEDVLTPDQREEAMERLKNVK